MLRAVAGWEILKLVSAEQPAASVTYTEYSPAARSFTSSVDAPLLQIHRYGSVPPAGVRLIDPVEPPKHATSSLTALRVIWH